MRPGPSDRAVCRAVPAVAGVAAKESIERCTGWTQANGRVGVWRRPPTEGTLMQVKELGHLVLYVRNLQRSAAFYGELLGWEAVVPARPGVPVAAFSSGRTHHELLLIEVGEHAAGVPAGSRTGLYHFGLRVGDSDDELREALARVEDAGVTVVGVSDHTVTHSLYVLDPDGNEVELYVDVPGVDWRADPAALLTPVKPLAL